jgi:hypothetical protein
MSTLTPIVVDLPAPPPVVLPHVLLEQPERDATTKAVLRYFAAERGSDHREHADAFDHLVAICYGWTLAMRNKKTGMPEGRYFLRDRHGSLKIEKTPQFSNKDGRRTGYNIREEGTANTATSAWVQEWLLKFLARYQGKSSQEIIAAADAGKFRYVGLACRQSLKQLVYRQHEREKKDRLTGFATATEHLGTNELGTASPLRDHVPFDQIDTAVDDARRVVMANADELEKLDLLTGLLAYLAVAEHVTEPHFEGRVTRAIADMCGGSGTAARVYKRKYHETIEREIDARNPALHSIIRELTHEPMTFASSISAEGADNRRLLRESRQLLAEYANDCRDQGLVKAATGAVVEAKRLSEAERRSEADEAKLSVQ